ncbi:hypothetical protein SARC_03865 [Sphaeroforma arctica JP610]|uniref:Uncharacterized protein n=1 Tax=Sphaeroforma arctica JP610 TaxID=667725 RepID=A0A0L0G503_9EUKA|nr:hypothetical protein SARC_03865 [Sphaeroforma arctica JP610]KNC83906.1 hypothetical protein SARC_03865 [Sphaeroforma arctica JP610]|eukprot:XP_014157808.1 hypothetical protein SARC_03865 [Sphaeroforma arctica JP610]
MSFLYPDYRTLEIRRLHSSTVKACIGLHPTEANLEILPDVLALIRKNAHDLVGIGECGLDFTPKVLGNDGDKVKQIQRHVFAAQAALSVELDLPLNVHSRCAGHHAISLLKEAGVKRCVLHAFDGKPKYARQAAESMGYFFSIPPSAVRSPEKRKLISQLPLSSLLIETDSPALGPTSKDRNVPSNAVIACQVISEVKGISAEEVAHTTTENATKLFKLSF